MDFRKCPACDSSVLDDDAEDCPFCGASMSGKPKPKPKPEAKPAQPKGEKKAPQEEQKSPNRPQRRKPAPAEKQEAGDDDNPFEVDTSIARKAVAVSPRPTKSRTLRVTCPMCETPGFINPTDAGKNVKCCNDTCMVPIFKAPVPEKEEEPEEEKSGGGILMYGGGAAAVIAAGVAVWWFVLREPEKPKPDNGGQVVQQGEVKIDLGGLADDHTISTERKKPETPVELRDITLERMSDLTESKQPEHLRLTASSFAQANKATEAKNTLDNLRRISGGRNGYQQVEPLVQLAWSSIQSANVASGYAAEAQKAMESVPSAIREPLDAASSLAALLVALDKTSDADALIQRIQTHDQPGRLSSIWSSAMNTGTFDFALETDRPYHVVLPAPLRVSAIHELVARGQAEKALSLIDGASDIASKESAFAAWAGRLGDVDAGAIARVEQAIGSKKIGKSGQVQAWAALASHYHASGEAANAQTALGKATAILDTLEVPAPTEMLSMKAIHGSKGKPHAGLSDPAPALAMTLAYATVGLLQADMGQVDAGWANVKKAADSARAMSPSPAKTAQVADDARKKPATVKAQLNAILNFGNNEQKASLEMGRYSTQADALNAVAQNRLNIQVTILREAARRGLGNQVWDYAQSMAKAPLDERDPYYTTSLPGWLKQLAEADGNQALVQKINAEYQDKVLRPRRIDQLYAAALKQVSSNQIAQARESLKSMYAWANQQQQQLTPAEPFEIDTIAFRLVSLVQRQQSDIAEAFEFTAMQKDAAMKADAFMLIAAKSVTTNKAYVLWDIVSNVRQDRPGITPPGVLDQLSMGRGFIAGLNVPASTPQQMNVSAAEK